MKTTAQPPVDLARATSDADCRSNTQAVRSRCPFLGVALASLVALTATLTNRTSLAVAQTKPQPETTTTPSAPQNPQALPCHLTPDETRTVIAVKDAATIILDGGTHVHLSGILPPHPPAELPAGSAWPPHHNAKKALSNLVATRTVTLAYVNPKRDRYGTIQAHVFIQKPANTNDPASTDFASPPPKYEWVQQILLSQGHARAFEPVGQSDCFAQLISFETVARKNNLGLWANNAYRALPAANTALLLNRRGLFVSVHGRIKSVAARSKYTYLNFGTNWSTDFTIAVPRALSRKHPSWANGLEALTSQNVEVQGWLKSRNGPNIELEHPAQLRVLAPKPPLNP